MARQVVASREYKIMLRPSRFAGNEKTVLKAASDFWHDLYRTVGSVVLGIEGDLGQIKVRRLIMFLDTEKHHINSARYIFRERRDLQSGEREVTLKFRHPDRNVAQDRNMDARDVKDGRTKFEEDVKTPFISLYSFSTTQKIRDDKDLNLLKDVAQLFPDIKDRLDEFDEDKALIVVDGISARELVIGGAGLVLGKSPRVEAECALIVWYNDGASKEEPIVVEFSYRYGNKNEDYSGVVAMRAYDVFNTMREGLEEWIDPESSTKTSHIYGS